MSQSIQIYSGSGASNLCVQAWKRELKDGVDGKLYRVEEFNGYDTSGLDRGNVALLIVPGGNACQMTDHLDEIVDKINQTIADKSSFLGSCAGAIVTYAKNLQHFNFNPLPYHSKYYLPHSDSVTDPENRSAIEVEWLPSYGHFQSDLCRLYHAYGPAFPLEEISQNTRNNCRVLAQYKTDGTSRKAENSAAVILYRPHRSTPRLLTGVHPELSTEDVLSPAFAKNYSKPDHPHIQALADSLKDSETIRKEMCRSWFAELDLKLQ